MHQMLKPASTCTDPDPDPENLRVLGAIRQIVVDNLLPADGSENGGAILGHGSDGIVLSRAA